MSFEYENLNLSYSISLQYFLTHLFFFQSLSHILITSLFCHGIGSQRPPLPPAPPPPIHINLAAKPNTSALGKHSANAMQSGCSDVEVCLCLCFVTFSKSVNQNTLSAPGPTHPTYSHAHSLVQG